VFVFVLPNRLREPLPDPETIEKHVGGTVPAVGD
jgi:hypothetical protein